MRVRRAVIDDAATLAGLNRLVHEPHLSRRPDYFTSPRLDEVAGWFRAQLEQTTTAAWVAEEHSVAVGYALVFFHERPANPFRRARRWCEIDQLGVDPAWRRRGIGSALMNAALAEASARGVADVELSSWAFNRDAHAMFERLGFAPRIVVFERRER